MDIRHLCCIGWCLLLSFAATAQQRFDPRELFERNEARRSALLRSLTFAAEPRADMCVAPEQTTPAQIDVDRSLFVHDRATLDAENFSLKRTLGQIASQVATTVPGTTAVKIFQQLWDTQNAAPGQINGPHCSDNGSTLNGFPVMCPRAEGNEAGGTDAQIEATMEGYTALALVNRLDLAHEGWRNCGEYRIIYGKNLTDIRRNLIIFEAVLPNPKPGCRDGCREVAQFWRSLSAIDAPAERAKLLAAFFYGDQPDTVLPGFRPVVHVDHYSAKGVSGGYGSSGSGQIRTNQFLQGPWMLREFKTAIDCGASPCTFAMVPIMVKVNPHGELWNEDRAQSGPLQALAQAFQAGVEADVSRLAAADITRIGYSVALEHDAGQSISQPNFPGESDLYLQRFQEATGPVNTFRTAVAAQAMAHGLSAAQIVNRALTQSCHGCHQPRLFGLEAPNSIGPVLTPNGGLRTNWPSALSFVHIDTPVDSNLFAGNPVFLKPDGSGPGHRLSDALTEVFLPARKNFLLSQLNLPTCACRNRFTFLPEGPRRQRALQIQDRIDERFVQDLAPQTREIESQPGTAAARTARQRAATLNAQRERDLSTQLSAAGLQPVPAAAVQTLRLNAAREARGDRALEAQLRRQEVLEVVREEPPRRTVTGSFAVH